MNRSSILQSTLARPVIHRRFTFFIHRSVETQRYRYLGPTLKLTCGILTSGLRTTLSVPINSSENEDSLFSVDQVFRTFEHIITQKPCWRDQHRERLHPHATFPCAGTLEWQCPGQVVHGEKDNYRQGLRLRSAVLGAECFSTGLYLTGGSDLESLDEDHESPVTVSAKRPVSWVSAPRRMCWLG